MCKNARQQRPRKGEGEGTEREKYDFRFGGWKILGVRGGYERRNDQSHPIFDGRRKMRGGGPPARYVKKWQRMAANIPTGCIGGGG